MAGEYRPSFGPWNVHEGADPFRPAVRRRRIFAGKLKAYRELGFDGVLFHAWAAVADMSDKLSVSRVLPDCAANCSAGSA